ncbi:hypothetical protein TNCV_4231551 [Trichonephila clavipes]|uniref:Uncharacterized protein n=1 Tax=Trichonephila clavipes TaxID=2585209 RepID=A0A8X6SGB1_TRICX|nr:hypothetical protein TNCV_4231551 [Trichonephila clavipes]
MSFCVRPSHWPKGNGRVIGPRSPGIGWCKSNRSRERGIMGYRGHIWRIITPQGVPGILGYTRAFDDVILNHGQVTWTTPELAPPSPNYHTNGRTFQLSTHLACTVVLSGTALELVTRPATIRYLYHSATAAFIK